MLIWSNQTKDFFTLPRDTQKVVQHQASDNPQRGWSSIGMEQTSHLYGRNSDRPDGEHKDCKVRQDLPTFRHERRNLQDCSVKIANQLYRSTMTLVHRTILNFQTNGYQIPSSQVGGRFVTFLPHYEGTDRLTKNEVHGKLLAAMSNGCYVTYFSH